MLSVFSSWSAEYKAWGECKPKNHTKRDIWDSEIITNNIRFQGQYYDDETGLHYNRYRYYSPYVGRFISKDPIGLLGGFNTYAYAPNSVEWIDPLGLQQGTNAVRHGPNIVQRVNGRMPINHCFAGKVMAGDDLPKSIRNKYSHGIPFNMRGFPDFSRHAKTTVNIGKFTDDSSDFRAANSKIGLSGKQAPTGYVWHHTEKDGIIQLLPRDIHDAVRHTGGAAVCGTRN